MRRRQTRRLGITRDSGDRRKPYPRENALAVSGMSNRAPLGKQNRTFGFEFVKGTLRLDCLSFHGYKVDDKSFLVPNSYTIFVSQDWKTFEGTTYEKNYGRGRMRGAISVPS